MITNFCVICGKTHGLHNHHIIPKGSSVKPKCGDYDDPTNLVTLCTEHHEWIHGLKPNRYNNWKHLQAEGIGRAKRRGVYKGKVTSIPTEKVRALRELGMGATEIAKTLNIGRASVYRHL